MLIRTPKNSDLSGKNSISFFGPKEEEEVFVATPQSPPLVSLPRQPPLANVPEDMEEFSLVIDEGSIKSLDLVKQSHLASTESLPKVCL